MVPKMWSSKGELSSGIGLNIAHGLALVVLLAWPAAAQAQTTCAVIASPGLGLDESPLLDLIELKLADNPELDLLNRSEIMKVLAEKGILLSLTSSREATRQVGTVLRADVLALLEAQKVANNKVVELYMVETRHGLRLARDLIVWDDQVERMASLLSRRIAQIAQRVRPPVAHVLAVPPFASEDLSYDFDHLKHVYARLVEQTILRIPGTIVVDLEHAREIAGELAISAGEAQVQRALPYYFEGHYHNHGRREDRRVDLKLVLRHGERIVASEEKASLQPAMISNLLKDMVMSMLVRHLGAEAQTNGSDALETDLLEEHARASQSLGYWEDAIRLTEACLLLDPDRHYLHFRIIEACDALLVDDFWGSNNKDQEAAKAQRRYALLGLEHLESHLRHFGYGEKERGLVGSYWAHSSLPFFRVLRYPDYLKELQREICLTKVNILIDVLNNNLLVRSKDDQWGTKNITALTRTAEWCLAKWEHIDHWGEEKLFTAEEVFNIYRRLILAFGQHQEGFDAQCRLIQYLFKYDQDHAQEYKQLLDELGQAQEGFTRLLPEFVQVIRSKEHRGVRKLEQQLAPILAQAYPGRRVEPSKLYGIRKVVYLSTRMWLRGRTYRPKVRFHPFGKVAFTPITLMPPDGEPFKQQALKNWGGWLACGNICDVIWGCEKVYVQQVGKRHSEPIAGYEQRRSHRLYVMKEPGKLIPLTRQDGTQWGTIGDIQWDGKYIWVVDGLGAGTIHVIDPTDLRTVAIFGPEDGVPPAKHLKFVALEVGKVCAVGHFGRTWIANLTLTVDQGGRIEKTVEVFHEARRLAEAGMSNDEVRFDLGLAFSPGFMISIRTQNPGRSLVLVGRGLGKHRSRPDKPANVLIVDPYNRIVRPFPHDWPKGIPLAHGDKVYIFGREFLSVWEGPGHAPRELIRLQPEGLDWSDLANNAAVCHNGVLHCVNHEWFSIDPKTPKLLRSKVRLPAELKGEYWTGPSLAVSSLYGLVYYDWDKGIFQVSFPDNNRQTPKPTSRRRGKERR